MSYEIGIIRWVEDRYKMPDKSLKKDAKNLSVDFNNEHVVEIYTNDNGIHAAAQHSKLPDFTPTYTNMYKTGSDPTVAINKHQVVVECHYGEKSYKKKGDGAIQYYKLYYNVGDVKNGALVWRNQATDQLDEDVTLKSEKNGLSVDINNNNLVAIAYNGHHDGTPTGTAIRIGKVENNKIQFLHREKLRYDKPDHNLYPCHETSICLTDDNIVILFTKAFHEFPFYSLGKYSDGKIDWWVKSKRIFPGSEHVTDFSASVNSNNNDKRNEYGHCYNEVVFMYARGKVLKYKFAEIDERNKRLNWMSDTGRYNLHDGITVQLDMDGKYMDVATRTSVSIDDAGKVIAAISNGRNGIVYRLVGTIDGLVGKDTTQYLTRVRDSEKVAGGIVVGLLKVASVIPTKYSSLFKATKSLTELAFKASIGNVGFYSSLTAGELISITEQLIKNRIDQKVAEKEINIVVQKYRDYEFYINTYNDAPGKFDQVLWDEFEKVIMDTHSSEFRAAVTTLGDPEIGRFGYTYYLIGSALLLFSIKFYAVKQAYRINENTGEINGYSNVTLKSFNEILNATKKANPAIDREVRKYIDFNKEGLITRRRNNLEHDLVNTLYGGDVELKNKAESLLNAIDTNDWPRPTLK